MFHLESLIFISKIEKKNIKRKSLIFILKMNIIVNFILNMNLKHGLKKDIYLKIFLINMMLMKKI